MDWLEALLGDGRSYIVGDLLTEADIRLCTTLFRFQAYREVFGFEFVRQFVEGTDHQIVFETGKIFEGGRGLADQFFSTTRAIETVEGLVRVAERGVRLHSNQDHRVVGIVGNQDISVGRTG